MQNDTIFPSAFVNRPTSVASKITLKTVAAVSLNAILTFIKDVAQLVLVGVVGVTLLMIVLILSFAVPTLVAESGLPVKDHGKMQQHSSAGNVSESGGVRTGGL